MDASDALERLLVAASLAVKVVSLPVRRDGTAPREYESSGPTFANRVKADPAAVLSVASEESPAPPPAPARYLWSVRVKAGAARQTLYKLWLEESPGEVDAVLAARKAAALLRASLPHEERRKKPWGPL